MTEPTINELVTSNVTNYETELNVDVPAQRRSWLRVNAVQQAVALKGLYKRATAAQKAIFAVTAGADGLAVIGREFECPREDAVKYVAACSVVCSDSATITAGTQLTSEASGAYYKVNATVSRVGAGALAFAVTAEDAGEAANLEAASLALSFVSPVTNAASQASITSVTTYGADEEDLEDWRARILEAERAAYGGGDFADYRTWAKVVSGVAQAYPYSGRPITWTIETNAAAFDATSNSVTINDPEYAPDFEALGTLGVGDMIQVAGSVSNDGYYTVQSYTITMGGAVIVVAETIVDEVAGPAVTFVNQSLPGDRTVFVEVSGASPIPSSGILSSVREAINYGENYATLPVYQPSVGDVESTLYVEPVGVDTFYIQILNFDCDAATADQCKAKIVEDVGSYFDLCRPFITGLDFEMDRRDVITDLSVGRVVQGVLDVYAAAADGVRISVGSKGADTVTSWQLSQGTIAALGTVYDTDGDW